MNEIEDLVRRLRNPLKTNDWKLRKEAADMLEGIKEKAELVAEIKRLNSEIAKLETSRKKFRDLAAKWSDELEEAEGQIKALKHKLGQMIA
jgi:septal ring factor EnvC (AmiA/AmiB activator)